MGWVDRSEPVSALSDAGSSCGCGSWSSQRRKKGGGGGVRRAPSARPSLPGREGDGRVRRSEGEAGAPFGGRARTPSRQQDKVVPCAAQVHSSLRSTVSSSQFFLRRLRYQRRVIHIDVHWPQSLVRSTRGYVAGGAAVKVPTRARAPQQDAAGLPPPTRALRTPSPIDRPSSAPSLPTPARWPPTRPSFRLSTRARRRRRSTP
jgi:hypothetical protein